MGVWIEMGIADLCGNVWEVAPFVGVWIEISECVYPIKSLIVAPFVGVWIEICNIHICWCICIWSLPSWECGLKSFERQWYSCPHCVAPFVGVWIEIHNRRIVSGLYIVAPFVGVWIEIVQ